MTFPSFQMLPMVVCLVCPLQLIFPYHYLTVEDEELALTAGGVVAPLVETFDVELGTTRLLAQCVR